MSDILSIDTLAGGAAREKLNIELRKVAANVKDPNTKADAVRTITMTIKFKPDEHREYGSSEISVKSSLAPSKGIPAMFVFDFDHDGEAVLKELQTRDPNQTIINDAGQHADATGAPLGNVVNGDFSGDNRKPSFR